MKNRKGILERVTIAMDLNGESMPKHPLVELVGDHRVLIENHQGVVQYAQQEICVKVSFGCVKVSGAKLEMARMTREQLVITGCIKSVTLVNRRK